MQSHWTPHPAVRTGGELSRGERLADAAVRWMGSWNFILVQTAIVTLWIVVNLIGILGKFDPYPFILLNLGFSTQAAYAAPLILLAQRRQDRRSAEVALHTMQTSDAIKAHIEAAMAFARVGVMTPVEAHRLLDEN